MRTADEYRASLRDGRVVYYEGQRVRDVTAHPALRVAVDHAALDYEMAADPRHRALAVVPRPGGGEMSRYFAIPRTAEDLLARMDLIEAGTRAGGTIVPLLKEIGTDALFALHLIGHDLDRARGTRYLDRIGAFYAHCRDNDLAMAVAQTDVKGDRGGVRVPAAAAPVWLVVCPRVPAVPHARPRAPPPAAAPVGRAKARGAGRGPPPRDKTRGRVAPPRTLRAKGTTTPLTARHTV